MPPIWFRPKRLGDEAVAGKAHCRGEDFAEGELSETTMGFAKSADGAGGGYRAEALNVIVVDDAGPSNEPVAASPVSSYMSGFAARGPFIGKPMTPP